MNNITIETVKGAMILLPGISWSLIWMKYSKNKPQADKFYFAVYAIVASAFSYLIYYLACSAVNKILCECDTLVVVEVFADSLKGFKTVFVATIISTLVALASVVLSHKKPIYWLMNKFNLTLNDGEVDVLVSSLRDHMKLGKYALVRIYDLQNNRIFVGLLVKVSEPCDNMEFVMSDCQIYKNPSGEKLLDLPRVYLCFDHKNFLIEFVKYEK